MIPNLRLYAYLAAAIALLGGYWYWHHHVYTKGHIDGAAEVQATFDGYRSSIAALTAQRAAENAVKAAQVQATNEAVIHGYQESLKAIANDRDSLSRRLREHQAGACSPFLPPVEDQPGATNASSQPSSQAEVDGLLDQLDQACRADSAQLDALIQELGPQLP